MIRCWPAIAALALSGCASAGNSAEEEYRIVEVTNPSPDELCAASRKVADGYLKDRDQEQYASWKNKAEVDCLNARLGSRLGTR